jgi:hypothetical protein
MRRSVRPRLSHGFQKHGARKDQAHRYRVVTRSSPPSICRNRGKKGARSGGGRRMSVAPSLVGAYQRIRGAIQGYICRRTYFHHQSLSWLTSAPRVCFVRTDRLGESTTPLHPPKTSTIAILLRSIMRVPSVSRRRALFSIPSSSPPTLKHYRSPPLSVLFVSLCVSQRDTNNTPE